MTGPDSRTLTEVLQSVSDVLFPDRLGQATVRPDSRDADGDTPLHVLVRRGDHHGVKLLIAAGADVNAAGDMGEIPLHAAVAGGDVAMVTALLAVGADPDRRSEFGETARERAARRGGDLAGLMRE